MSFQPSQKVQQCKLPRLVPFRRYEVITSVVAPTAQAAEDDGGWIFWVGIFGLGKCGGYLRKKSWFTRVVAVCLLEVFGLKLQNEVSTDPL